MTDLQRLYTAALLHDIGKFIERAKDSDIQDAVHNYYQDKTASKNISHRGYSAWLIDQFKAEKDFLNDEHLRNLVLWHHNGNDSDCEDYESINNKGILLKLLRIADDLAPSGSLTDSQEEGVDYYLGNIHSPFKSDHGSKNFYINPHKLSLDKKSFFPSGSKSTAENHYKSLLKDFLEEFQYVGDDEKLLYLLEKYLVNVPAQNPVEVDGKELLFSPDIGLYDHSRCVAAIALCLYLEYLHGTWKGKDDVIFADDYLQKGLEPPVILISGNLSGVRKFILSQESAKDALILKGKSFFIKLLTEVCVKYIIEKLELRPANVLHSGNGNFYILSPAYTRNQLGEIIQLVNKTLDELNLYLLYGVTEVELNDFKDFGSVLQRANLELKKNSRNKYKLLKWEEVFNPARPQPPKDNIYSVVTEKLHYNRLQIRDYAPGEEIEEFQYPFMKLNYAVDFISDDNGVGNESTVLNTTDFVKTNKGFKFTVKYLPAWNDGNKAEFKRKNTSSDGSNIFPAVQADENIMSFERLSQFAYFETGTQKLGVLRLNISTLRDEMPIDNQMVKVVSRMRALEWFFEGYLNTMLNESEYKDQLFVSNMGEYELFVVGGWNKLFDFSTRVVHDFRKYVSNYPEFRISGAVLTVDHKKPMYRIADIAEKRLQKAQQDSSMENAVSVFDSVISWEDFYQAKLLTDKMVELVQKTGKRAVIEKVRKSASGFEKINMQTGRGNVDMTKVWRLAYYLRDLINPKEKGDQSVYIKNKVEEIVKQYEELIFKALKGEPTSVKIFPIAARWAEFETR